MLPEISEFSYGYALTSELMNQYQLKSAGAPEFATQSAEGKPGGGWDMKLPGIPMYLQFKRSDRMIAVHAKEAHRFPSLPYFRMHLHRRDLSDQHKLLLNLEAHGNIVRYAAPGFSYSRELHDHYSMDEVANNSIFISPSIIGPLPDDTKHSVAFHIPASMTFFCSEPRRIETDTAEILFTKVAENQLKERGRPVNREFFEGIGDELIEIYERRRQSVDENSRIERIRALGDRRQPADFAQLIARTLFSAEIIIFAPDAKSKDKT